MKLNGNYGVEHFVWKSWAKFPQRLFILVYWPKRDFLIWYLTAAQCLTYKHMDMFWALPHVQGSGTKHGCSAVRRSWRSVRNKKQNTKSDECTGSCCTMDNFDLTTITCVTREKWEQKSLRASVSHWPWLHWRWGPAVCWPAPPAAVWELAAGRWGQAPGRTGWTAGRPDRDTTRPPGAKTGAGQGQDSSHYYGASRQSLSTAV